MRRLCVGLVLMLIVGVLVGCKGEEAGSVAVDTGSGESFVSAALDMSYDGALAASSQLVLGTLKLEGTGDAVTPEQAQSLLPLWQALRGGVTAQAEINAVLKQIEGTMTQEQLAAIAAMQLTQEDLAAWMQEQGPGMGAGFPGQSGGRDVSPEVQATRQAAFAADDAPPFGDGEMPPEMATRRAEFENMSDEERQSLRATRQAGGGFQGGVGPGGRGGAGGGQFFFLLNPLVDLLTQRAGE